MGDEFALIHNRHEQAVLDAVKALSPHYPDVQADPSLLADVACVALNRLPPRYIRHDTDYLFYLTQPEREAQDRAVTEAVHDAFSFVQQRVASSSVRS